MDQIAFLVLSALCIGGALLVIFSKNPIYSVLFLILTFFSIAGHYILMNAQFLAIVHIVVYSGAIMVLFLFVIMLLNLNKEAEPKLSLIMKLAGIIAGSLLLLTIFGAMKGMTIQVSENTTLTDIGLVKPLGKVLFTEFLLPFEVSSVLFLSAMIGAVMLGKKDLKDH
jgi:NADH-quinone oxidoreductase subunit J